MVYLVKCSIYKNQQIKIVNVQNHWLTNIFVNTRNNRRDEEK